MPMFRYRETPTGAVQCCRLVVLSRYVCSCALGLCLLMASQPSAAAPPALLLRLFLRDGTALVSYGEFARLDDHVVLSMPVGELTSEPRLQVVSLPAGVVDWPRTERYRTSARAHHYATTRGEADYQQLSADVARILNSVATAPNPAAALTMVTHARSALAQWPAAHYNYRQRDVQEIVALLDETVADLRARAGVGAFDVALTTGTREVPLPEPPLDPPTSRDLVSGMLAAARVVEKAADRVALLQSALVVVDEGRQGFGKKERSSLRSSLRDQIRHERDVDRRYAELSTELVKQGAKAASAARVSDLEEALSRLADHDEKFGRRRPEVVDGVRATLSGQLESARRLRLLQDQWTQRQEAFRTYQRTSSAQIMQLVKAQSALDAIRRLDGPSPEVLRRLRTRLDGGSEQLTRQGAPAELATVHETFVGAWRFAEQAIRARQSAIGAASVATAWEASSAAAAALMMIANAQRELSALLDRPQLR